MMNKKNVYFGGFAFSALIVLFTVSALTFRYMKGLSLLQLKAAIEGLGGMASVAFIMMCAVRGLVFIPCGLLSALGGLLFGPLMGTAFALIGLTAGSVITFYLARNLGKSWAERTLGHKYDKYEGYISKDSFYSIFLMRVVPILPFDVVSCIAGMSRVGAGKYMLATLIGSLPGIFIYVFFGDSIRSLSIRRGALSAVFITVFALIPFSYKYFMKLFKKIA
jgi:uncharacterized membrane protein YdjX (TVP38/TMEM64 family)